MAKPATAGPKRAAIYTRISADPEGRALGVHDQAIRSRELARQRGWQIIEPGCECKDCQRFGVPADVYCDNDITAEGKRKRPHYERLLCDIEAGRVDVVVTVHTDRLHRNVSELERYINVCEPRKVETHTIKAGELDLTTSSGRMVARMLGAAARHELERMMERQKDAKRRIRDAGLHVGGHRPYGYRLDNNAETGLVLVEHEAAAVRDAYQMVLAGASLNSIVTDWNRRGLRTPEDAARGGDNPWNVASLRTVLRRATNAGLVEHRGETVGRGKWSAIVDEDIWRSVRAVLADPSRVTSPGPKPRWLLTGVLICGVCEGRVFGVQRGGSARKYPDPHFYYTCNSATKAPGMPGVTKHVFRNVVTLDRYVEGIILERLRRPDAAKAFAGPAVDIAALDARRSTLNAELDAFARQSGITPRQLSIVSEPKVAELKQIESEISRALRGSPLREFAGDEDPADIWASLDIERRRAVAKVLLRVRLYPATRTRPAGWKVGDVVPFDYDAVKILPPDSTSHQL